MLQVSELFIYPIKSLGGIALQTAEITDRGLKHDRRWMLIDNNNRFLSQREFAQMALMKVTLEDDGLLVTYQPDGSTLKIPFSPQTDTEVDVVIWDDTCKALLACPEADKWFSDHLNFNCRLVYMPDHCIREVDSLYAKHKEVTSFSDGYPFLIIGQSSLDDLNSRLADKITIDRFRPNIVFTGGAPYQEDEMFQFSINNVVFYGVKRCARCVVITIDQQTIIKNPAPTRALASYRFQNNKIYFGQNLLHRGNGNINVGNDVLIIS